MAEELQQSSQQCLHHFITVGKWCYSNHLGNIVATISDELKSDNTALVLNANDYYPFGMSQPDRSYSSIDYRYGFNGQERSSEIGDNSYTAQFWEYDSRISRRWNLDPIYHFEESRYSVNGNSPLAYCDPNGDFRTKFGARLYKMFHGGEISQARDAGRAGQWFVSKEVEAQGNRQEVVVRRVFDWNSDRERASIFVKENILTPADAVLSAKVEVKATFGAQSGMEVEVADRKIGVDLTLASITLAKASYERQYAKKYIGTFDEFILYGKNDNGENYVEINQGVSGGIGIVSAGISREFKGKRYGYEDASTEYSAALGPASLTVKRGEDGNVIENKLNVARGKLSLLVGIEIKVSFGTTTEILK